MKIIFLDIDGVLNNFDTFKKVHQIYLETGKHIPEIDEFRIPYLKEIVDKTGSLIVLSSSWRYFCAKKNNEVVTFNHKMQYLLDLLKKYDLCICDFTPKLGEAREKEIEAYLSDKDVESFAIIDDESSDLMFYLDELVKTSTLPDGEMLRDMRSCEGLCEKHISIAINILNKEKKLIKK